MTGCKYCLQGLMCHRDWINIHGVFEGNGLQMRHFDEFAVLWRVSADFPCLVGLGYCATSHPLPHFIILQ